MSDQDSIKSKEIGLDMEEVYENPDDSTKSFNSSESSAPIVLQKERVLKGKILLNYGITKTNFYSAWIFIFYLGLIGVSFSTLEPSYIVKQFHIPEGDIGKMTAWLYLMDYTVRLMFALLYGPMIDYFGRKFVMGIGITLTSVGYFLIPIFNSSLYSGYFLAKAFISCGVIALQMLPFSADYVDNSTKGLMTGINYGMAFFGASSGAVFLRTLISIGLSFRWIYWIFGMIIFSLGFILRIGIKGGNTYYKKNQSPSQNGKEAALSYQFKEAIRAYREIPWVSMGLIFGILGNTDFYIITTGLVIWIRSMLESGEEATAIATIFQAIFFGLSFLVTVVLSLRIDKTSHLKLIFPILIIASLGYFLIPLIKTPTTPLIYLFFVIEGISLPGVFVFGTYLGMRYNPNHVRGTLSGISNGLGFLGAILILSVGGFLHDNWRHDANFLLYGALLWMSLLLVIIIYYSFQTYFKSKDDTNMKENQVQMEAYTK